MTTVSHPVYPNAMRRSAWRTVGRTLRCAALAIPPLALGFELWTHACMNLLIDPIPSWGHAALVALVPIAMLRAHRSLTGPRSDRDRIQIDTALLATACGISLAYCAGMLPIIAMALLVFVYLPIIAFFVAAAALRAETLGELGGFAIAPGLALIALAPVIGLIASATYYARLRRRLTAPIGRRFVRFFLLGFALFALAEIPGAAAHYGLSPHSATDDSALRIAVLRALTTEPAMIRAARFGPHNAHVWGWLLDRAFRGGGWFAEGSIYEPGAEEKRFFRVTGKSLRGAPAVRLVGNSTPAAAWIEEATGSFDALQGGDEVGRGLGDVHWVGSELEGELHPDGEFAYLEWTLVFRNVGVRAREARALLRLPEGAVVSRTTLWVNGEEREGSFASKSATRAAYENVVREQRDPLLVSASRVDEVLVQCFPVPPNGGEMKIRIGITAPLLPHGSDGLAVSLPYFIEQNFARSEEVDQRIELRSPEGEVEVKWRPGWWRERRSNLRSGFPTREARTAS